MKRAVCILISTLIAIVVMACTLVWLARRQALQDRLNDALIAAVRQHDLNAIFLLRMRGADPNARETPDQHLPVWQRLLNLMLMRSPQPTGDPALLVAVKRVQEPHFYSGPPWGEEGPLPMRSCRDLDLVQTLLDHGASVNMKDKEGSTALHYAVLMWPPMALLLLDYGADPNIRDRSGDTALTAMCSQPVHDNTLIWPLLQHHANVNAVNNKGETAMMHAVSCSDEYLVFALLHSHASLQLADQHGQKALTLAYEQLHAVAAPASTDIQDSYHRAKRIIHLLEQAGARQ